MIQNILKYFTITRNYLAKVTKLSDMLFLEAEFRTEGKSQLDFSAYMEYVK